VGQFGDKFRKAREKKNISLDDVSNVTKISARMLKAIEDEHFDQLPGGVFNKGFIRAYAKHIGLDGDEAVNEYLACLRQAQIDAQAVWEPNTGSGKRPQVAAHQIAANQVVASKVSHRTGSGTPAQSDSGPEELHELQLPRVQDIRPPRRQFPRKQNPLPWRPVIIAVLLVFAAVVVWQRYERHARAASAGIPALPVSQPPQSIPAATPEPAASQPTPPRAPQVRNARASEKTSQAENRSTTPAAKKPASSAADTSAEDEGASAPDAASAAPVAKTPAHFTLVIHADENSWISVTADGQPISHETLIAPADASFRANSQIAVRIGNAAGVSFVWNGQQFQPQGAEAEVKTFVFDESGMHEMATGPSANQSHAIP
jgi:cytoskeleton protein RodZ